MVSAAYLFFTAVLASSAEPQDIRPYVAVTKHRVFVVNSDGKETPATESFSVSARDRHGRTIKGPLSSGALLAVTTGVLIDPVTRRRYEIDGRSRTFRQTAMLASAPSGQPTAAEMYAAANGTKQVRGMNCLTVPAHGPKPGGGMGVIGYNCIAPDLGGLDLEADLTMEAGGKILHVISEISELRFEDPPLELMALPKGYTQATQ